MTTSTKPLKKPLFRLHGGLMALPATLWLLMFFIAPLVIVVAVSFMQRGPRGGLVQEWTTENYVYVDNLYKPILERSVYIAAYTTGICLLLGYPLAFFISTRKSARMRQISLFMVILPFWTNFLIRTYAWRVLLGNEGLINTVLLDIGLITKPLEIIFTERAVTIGMVYGFLPFMVLPIYASVERFDFRLVEAAHDLGANDWSAFWRIVFPLTLPGVVAGCILVFIPAVGAFVTPDLLGGRDGLMIGNLIQRNFRGTGHWPRGAATSIALMAIVAAGLILYMLVVERSNRTPRPVLGGVEPQNKWVAQFNQAKAMLMKPIDLFTDKLSSYISLIQRQVQLSQVWRIRRDMAIRWVGKIGLWFNPVVCYAFLWMPIVVLVVFSFNDSRSTNVWGGFTTQWYNNIANDVVGVEARFSTAIMLESLKNSMIVSLTATFLSTVMGTMVALSLIRSKFFGKPILSGLLYLPVSIPEITQGISLLLFFNIIFDYLARVWGIDLKFGYSTIIIGHVAFNISFVAIVVQARLADMNPRYEEAARDLGANEWRTFWQVTFPLILPGVLAGALLAFTLSLDDFVVTFFTSGVGTTTLTVFVYGLLKLTVTPEINAISTIMIVASTLLVGLSLFLQGRSTNR